MSFENFNLHNQLLVNIKNMNFFEPTKIQNLVINNVLDNKDILAIAQTGSGKTAAYLIPIINKLISELSNNNNNPRCIILVPTRDLLNQVYDTFVALNKEFHLNVCKVMGGTDKRKQIDLLKQKVDVIIAVMGRFKDLLNQQAIDISNLKYLIIDEFDKMLDIGFRKEILSLKQMLQDKNVEHQTLLFSATNSSDLKSTISKCLKENFLLVQVEEKETINDLIKQTFFIMHRSHIVEQLLKIVFNNNEKTLIFVNTINDCNNIENLFRYLNVSIKSIHGDRSQQYRDQIIEDFKNNQFSVLVATDVLSRGIDIKNLKLVINYHIPESIETYIHRIGRVGRNKLKGRVITLSDIKDEQKVMKIIDKYKLEAKVVSQEDWKSPSKQNIKDVINNYFLKKA